MLISEVSPSLYKSSENLFPVTEEGWQPRLYTHLFPGAWQICSLHHKLGCTCSRKPGALILNKKKNIGMGCFIMVFSFNLVSYSENSFIQKFSTKVDKLKAYHKAFWLCRVVVKFVVNSKLAPKKHAQVLVGFDRVLATRRQKKIFPGTKNEGLLTYVSVDLKQVCLFACLTSTYITWEICVWLYFPLVVWEQLKYKMYNSKF